MEIVGGPVLMVIDIVLNLISWAVIISAILSWLVAFNVVNPSNQFVYTIGNFLWKLTEPMLAPIRRVIPNVGGMDLSPLVLLLAIFLLRGVLANLAVSMSM